jgi:nucleotide-binding universal stress UspA family protein
MKSYKIEKILLPVDFSETSSLAIEHASIIAKAFKAEIILLHVLEKHWEKFSIIVPEMRVSLPDDVITIIEKRLEETAQSIFLNHGVKTSCITSHGTIFSEIIAVSHEHQVDLIVMGTHGVSGFIDFFIGSNTFRVVTSSECPVLSIQTNYHQTGFKNILLPIVFQ